MHVLPIFVALALTSASAPPAADDDSRSQLPRAAPAPEAGASALNFAERSVGVHVGLNLGLFALDVQRDHFYGFAAGNLGIPLVTNGAGWSAILGLGYSLQLSSPGQTKWMMDVFGMGAPGGLSGGWGDTNFYTAVGLGVGFRMLHRSGFTLGFKIPVFGMAFGPAVAWNGQFRGDASVGLFYLASGISLPVVSFGYRF